MRQRNLRQAAWMTALAIMAAFSTSPVAAHGTERGFVLLLPTGYYLAGGALAVAASFLLIAFVPPRALDRIVHARLPLASIAEPSPAPASLASFVFFAALVLVGFAGSRAPLANPLPLTIWTIWWVGLTLSHVVLGNLWSFLNPWTGPYRLLDRLAGGRFSSAKLPYPMRLGYSPALILFFAFAWFELVYPAPDDPQRLAVAVGLYWFFAFAGVLVFGDAEWRERAEPFSIFFRLIGGLSPLVVGPPAGRRRSLALAVPGAALVERAPLPISGVLFVLLTLSSVSFDGLSKTFWWLGIGGINPLEYPGRSALVERNSLGLLIAFLALAIVYGSAVRLGLLMARVREQLSPALGSFIYSIIPISIAFHFAHYLTALLVDGQYAAIAASDPFATGLDLLGLRDHQVTTSFLNTYSGVRAIWNTQTVAIVLGHVLAIALAHALALRRFGVTRQAAISQIPLATMMVLYTLFGLWLLSTPVAA